MERGREKEMTKTRNCSNVSGTYNDLIFWIATLRSEQNEQPNLSNNPPSNIDKKATKSPENKSKA